MARILCWLRYAPRSCDQVSLYFGARRLECGKESSRFVRWAGTRPGRMRWLFHDGVRPLRRPRHCTLRGQHCQHAIMPSSPRSLATHQPRVHETSTNIPSAFDRWPGHLQSTLSGSLRCERSLTRDTFSIKATHALGHTWTRSTTPREHGPSRSSVMVRKA